MTTFDWVAWGREDDLDFCGPEGLHCDPNWTAGGTYEEVAPLRLTGGALAESGTFGGAPRGAVQVSLCLHLRSVCDVPLGQNIT